MRVISRNVIPIRQRMIVLIGPGSPVMCNLTCTMEGVEYTIEIVTEQQICAVTAESAFGALAELRTALQCDGLTPAVQGACIDVYPSGLQLNMTGGVRAYRRSGSARPSVVEIFADVPECEYDRLVTVREQRVNFENMRGLRNGG